MIEEPELEDAAQDIRRRKKVNNLMWSDYRFYKANDPLQVQELFIMGRDIYSNIYSKFFKNRGSSVNHNADHNEK